MTDKLYSSLVCALTHNLEVCENCKKCPGKDFAKIRLNLVKELVQVLNTKLPWKDKEEN